MTGIGIGISPCFNRGRLSQDFPYTLSGNNRLWIRADDTSDPVASWVDRYGNYTLSQGTGTRQPAKDVGPNDKPIVVYDGVNTTGDVLVSTGTYGTTVSAYTLSIVFNRDPEKSHNGLFGLDDTPANHANNAVLEVYISTGAVISIVHNRATGIKFIQPSQASSSLPNAGTWCVMTIIWEAGKRPAIYIDGVLTVSAVTDATWTALLATNSYIVSGLGNDSTIGYHNNGIAETIFINAALSGSTLTSHHSYLTSRYLL